MKKHLSDFTVIEKTRLTAHFVLLKFTHPNPLPEMLPGQFAEVKIDNSPETFLRRPFSINYFDKIKNEFWLLIRLVGKGTLKLSEINPGDKVNMILPLGNSFSLPKSLNAKTLLIGGGCGTAPMLFLGAYLKAKGFAPTFLLGARSKPDLLQLDEFAKYGAVLITTEDGSAGEKGYITRHSILETDTFDHVYTCGPKPMMQAVANHAKEKNIFCEVSLENTMACGFGVCLCCVENTCEGNICVCKEGPVFNIKKLLW